MSTEKITPISAEPIEELKENTTKESQNQSQESTKQSVEALVDAVAQKAEKRTEKPSEQIVDAVVQKAEKRTEKPSEQIVDAVVQKAEKRTEKPSEQIVEAVAQKAEKRTEKPSEQIVEAVAQKAEKRTEKPSEQIVEAVAQKAEKRTEKPSEQIVEAVDFSDEEAELAGESPEFDLGDESQEEIEQEEQKQEIKTKKEPSSETKKADDEFDLTGKDRDQLLDIFAKLLQKNQVQKIRAEVEAIKVAFYKIHRAEVEQLRKKFIDNGGEAEEFTPPQSPQEERLKELFKEYRSRRDEYIEKLEHSKKDNLKVRLGVIEELKELINSSETMNSTFNTFRELQQKWRDAGAVPQSDVKGLWETYNHHVENFYGFVQINKELRDLDLKRNYEQKIALCEEAEELIMEPSAVVAFRKLQKLHDHWRETGPVSREQKEAIWDRFKEASARINKEHQDHFEGIKEEQKTNLKLKGELCARVDQLADGVWTKRKEWNKASDQLLEIQKMWKTIGFAPKKQNAQIYERFRNACDRFFERKRKYYLSLKGEMEHNLAVKSELCEQAEALSTSTDWKKTTDQIIALQNRWKESGAVSRRHSDAIWRRFRAACNLFFDNKSKHFATQELGYKENLESKIALLDEVEKADFKTGGFELIKGFQSRWSELGFVPIKQKDAIQKRYKEVMDVAFSTLREGGKDVQMERYRAKVTGIKSGGGDRKLRNERDRLFARMKQMEADIALLENNIGFFANSKGAEKMIKGVREQIERSREDMNALIAKIDMIDSQSQQ